MSGHTAGLLFALAIWIIIVCVVAGMVEEWWQDRRRGP